MALQLHTLINVEREPDGYHALEGGRAAFAVHLSAEVVVTGDSPAPEAVTQAYRDWLSALPTLKFFVGNKANGLRPANDVISDTGASLTPEVGAWLGGEIAQGRCVPLRADKPGDGTTLDVDAGNQSDFRFTVSEVLRSTATWLPPIPQRAGFTYILKVDTPGSDEYIVAVAGESPQVTAIDTAAKPAGLTVESTLEESKVTSYIRTFALAPAADLPGVVGADGFFKADASSDDDYRLLRRLQETAASSFWTLPHLLATDTGALQQVHGTDQWQPLVQAAAASALDPILIALLMPGTTGSEGHLLATLVDTGLDVLKETGTEKLRDWLRKDFVGKLRALIRDKFGSSMTANDLVEVLGLSKSDPIRRTLEPSHPQQPPALKEVLTRLREAVADLQDEGGAEACVIRMLRRFFPPTSDVLLEGFQDDEKRVIRQQLERVFTAFEVTLRGRYNGAEAVRRTVGQVFLDLLTRPNVTDVPTTIAKTQFFVRRMGLAATGKHDVSLDAIIEALSKPSLEALGPLAGELKEALDHEVHALAPQKERRFVPDPVPQPLHIRVATGTDAADMERFREAFQGIGVLVKRGDETWRHACLVDATREETDLQKNTLHPLAMVPNDGQQALFLEYHGFPLASPAFGKSGEALPGVIEPFYRVEDIQDPAWAPPKLAYGLDYGIAAFAVTEAGSLPKALQGARPWRLRDKSIPDPPHYLAKYRRRTAVGRIDIRHAKEAPPSQRRIGARYADVHPLCEDFPRVAVTAGKDSVGTLDLFRNADGSGGIALPSQNNGITWPVDVRLEDLQVLGGNRTVWIHAYAVGGQEYPPKDKGVVLTSPGGDCSVAIYKDNSDLPTDPKEGDPVPVVLSGSGPSSWLRLTVRSNDDNPTTLSLARPETDAMERRYSSDTAPPVLLLAPDEKGTWRAPFRDACKARLALSRVGFLDFEHWIANSDRLGELRKAAGWPDKADDFPALADILTTGYVAREHLPKDARAEVSLAELLERLPDPAVSHFVVAIEPLDSLSGDAQPKLRLFSCSPLPPWKDGLDSANLPKKIGEWQESDINTFFTRVDEHATWNLEFRCGEKSDITADETERSLVVTLPPGVSANVRVRPLVAEQLIDQMFDPRMRELLVGEWKDPKDGENHLMLDGACVTVETLSDGLQTKDVANVARAISVMPAGTDRAYDIGVTLPGDSDQEKESRGIWRHVKHVESFTQRWRFSGVPIYNWISPRDYGPEKSPATAAVPIDPGSDKDKAAALLQFEGEIYFGRDAADADSVKTRLEPGGTPTTIQRIIWPEPSATWFRHRFRLWSRYCGAMLKGSPSLDIWDGKDELAGWNNRVAMLADPARVQLTRPQLRALMPLTRRPSNPIEGAKALSPSLVCINQEPPFAGGGLADRFLAGIATGVGYGFDGTVGAPGSVKPQDLRREIGPDPRTDLRPFNEESGREATFAVVGPVGLHFERADVSAPAWSNSQHVLHPILLSDTDTIVRPETFLAAHTVRMLDPDWVLDREVPRGGNPIELDPAVPWLIDIQDGAEIERTMTLGKQVVAKITKDDSTHNVELASPVVDPSSQADTFLPLCRAHTDRVGGLRLIHQPIGVGAGRLTVLVMPDSKQAKPESDRPLVPHLLASMEWAAPPPASTEGTVPPPTAPAQLVLNGTGLTARRAYISDSTAMRWVRTAVPSNVVHAATDADTRTAHEIVDSADAAAGAGLALCRAEAAYEVVSRGPSRQLLWLQPDEGRSNLPRTMHRHLMAVLLKTTDGPGGAVDLYADALLVAGRQLNSPRLNGLSITGLRIGELQVPARSLGGGNASIPDEYRRPYFDAYSLGAENAVCFHFYVRFVRREETTEPVFALWVTPQALNGEDSPPVVLEVGRPDNVAAPGNNESRLRALDVWLFKALGQWTLASRRRFWSGNLGQIEKGATASMPGQVLGFTVEMQSKGGELWADVSMLPSRREFDLTDPDRFDFDWIFSSDGGLTDVAAAVGPDALTAMPEVAAQLVSWSPPIRIA